MCKQELGRVTALVRVVCSITMLNSSAPYAPVELDPEIWPIRLGHNLYNYIHHSDRHYQANWLSNNGSELNSRGSMFKSRTGH